jgi:hypothetical protein
LKFYFIAYYYRDGYLKANKRNRLQVIGKIVQLVAEQDPPGRFLDVYHDGLAAHGNEENPTSTARYYLADVERVHELVRQTLLDKKYITCPKAGLSIQEQATLTSLVKTSTRFRSKQPLTHRKRLTFKRSMSCRLVSPFPISDKKPVTQKYFAPMSTRATEKNLNVSETKPSLTVTTSERHTTKSVPSTLRPDFKPYNSLYAAKHDPAEVSFEEWSEFIREAKRYLAQRNLTDENHSN